jgi:uncharacterized protein (DUF3820 family)
VNDTIARIETAKKAREDAVAMFELIGEQPARFWEVLAELVASKLPAPAVDPANEPMEYAEAAKFERDEMPYGKYQGERIGEVPPDYLTWFSDGDEFKRRLNRYVRSQMFQDRQE